jgi:aminotransferase
VAGITALGLPDSYYQRVVAEYDERRALLLSILTETGFQASPPKGAYYVMADISTCFRTM